MAHQEWERIAAVDYRPPVLVGPVEARVHVEKGGGYRRHDRQWQRADHLAGCGGAAGAGGAGGRARQDSVLPYLTCHSLTQHTTIALLLCRLPPAPALLLCGGSRFLGGPIARATVGEYLWGYYYFLLPFVNL